MQTEKVSKVKGKKFWWKVAAWIVGISIVFSLGSNSASVDLGKEKVKLDKLTSMVKDKQSKLDAINNEYKSKLAEFEVAKKVVADKTSAENQIAELNKQIDSKKGEITGLDSQIKSKNDQLASLTGQIQAKNEAPKVLPAGMFVVGKDIPAGRYKAVPNGGNGNFFVNKGAKVNIMLGSGKFYQSEYVFQASNGDEIELTLSAKFIPVE
jgi:multidrug efflux pump subunit AcrA (membrane-fusion protein)